MLYAFGGDLHKWRCVVQKIFHHLETVRFHFFQVQLVVLYTMLTSSILVEPIGSKLHHPSAKSDCPFTNTPICVANLLCKSRPNKAEICLTLCLKPKF